MMALKFIIIPKGSTFIHQAIINLMVRLVVEGCINANLLQTVAFVEVQSTMPAPSKTAKIAVEA